jgi:hypothetical protein
MPADRTCASQCFTNGACASQCCVALLGDDGQRLSYGACNAPDSTRSNCTGP